MKESSQKQLSLSKTAYGGIKGEDYVPFISTTEAMPEMTGYSLLMGILFAVLFAAANTYLGLKVGLTISAAIPGAILATGVFKGLFRRNNILEANMVASMAAVGESIAGGVIFILPALILIGMELSIMTTVIVTIIGGGMGVFFITPVRRYLVVEEHGSLVYPEGMAASEVLVTGSQGGEGFNTVMKGLGIGAAYKLLSGGLGFWKESSEYFFKNYQNTKFGVDTLASLLGVGFIVGTKTSMLMFGGSVIAWFGLIPLIKYFGEGLAVPLFPSTVIISEMSAQDVWGQYIRYIGAGAVATGGFISLAKSLPTIISSFRQALAGMKAGQEGARASRIDQDAPLTWVLIATIFGFLLTWFVPMIGGGAVGALMAVLFTFFFAVVSGRMVGIVGASNNPVSGMTIASLLVIATIMKVMGQSDANGVRTALMLGGIVCVGIAVGGGVAQSLKTTYILGGTPKKVQIGMFSALAVGAFGVAATILVLDKAYGIGGKEVPAPQAGMMKMIVEGIMSAQLPWTLVIIGAALAFFCFLANLPILAVALGIYLPINLNAAILIGGLLREVIERVNAKDEAKKERAVERGILLGSGLVAGDALLGIAIGGIAAMKWDITFGARLVGEQLASSELIPFIAFMALAVWVFTFSNRNNKKNA